MNAIRQCEMRPGRAVKRTDGRGGSRGAEEWNITDGPRIEYRMDDNGLAAWSTERKK